MCFPYKRLAMCVYCVATDVDVSVSNVQITKKTASRNGEAVFFVVALSISRLPSACEQ